MSILFRHGYKNKSRLNSGLKPARFLGFQSFSKFSPVFPSKSAFFLQPICFCLNMFCFYLIIFFVCLFVFAINFVRFLLFSKLKTNPDSTEDSIPESNLHVSLFFVFQHFSMFFFQNQHCAVNLFFLFFSFLPSLCFLFVFLDPSVESRFSICFFLSACVFVF